jgi:uncharacterized protein
MTREVPVGANICVECGICCDGTMFGYAELEPGDNPEVLVTMGLAVVRNGDQGGFQLPCPCLVDRTCTVYDDRPSPCRRYKCAMLLDHEAGRVSTEDALATIGRTIALRDRLRPDLEALVDSPIPVPFSGLHAMLATADETHADDAADVLHRAAVAADVATLRRLLADHFDLPLAVATASPI